MPITEVPAFEERTLQRDIRVVYVDLKSGELQMRVPQISIADAADIMALKAIVCALVAATAIEVERASGTASAQSWAHLLARAALEAIQELPIGESEVPNEAAVEFR
jgi:hypothetical protein